MAVWSAIISQVISTGINLAARAGGPNYPSPPKIKGIDIPAAQSQMESYEASRMQASIDAWKAKFPLLYQGGQYEIGDIGRNQQGMLSPTTVQSLQNAGLDVPKQGNQYDLSTELGMSPITLAQRTSQAVTRQIAMNPEWTNKISGGTLATMMANNYKNQNAFAQFLGAQNTANYVNQQTANAYNTQALTSGILGAAGIATQYGINRAQSNYLNLGGYAQGMYYPQAGPSALPSPSSSQPTGLSYQPYQSQLWNQYPPASNDLWGGYQFGNPYGYGQPSSYMYSGTWSPSFTGG